MSNIEYYGLECLEDAELKHYRITQKRKARILTERYNKNKEAFALMEEHEELQQREAFAAYRKKRAMSKQGSDKDDKLYHLNGGR